MLVRTPARTRRAAAAAGVALAAALSLGVADATSVTLVPTAAAADLPKDIGLAFETSSIDQIQALLKARKGTSVDLVKLYTARIKQTNTNGPGLNAVRALNPNAEKEAKVLDAERKAGKLRGPLHGIPVLVKDNIDVKGMPTTAGSFALKDSYPADDAPVVKELREAGAVILGKTNLSEFANFTTSGMPSGYSSLGGQVLNPYDASQTPSGSSSGSGVAAAAGMAAAAVGTETSGSILSPANANSLVGVKPTVGLVSRTGIIPISATQDTAGPMTKTVYDAAAMLSGMAGVDPEDPATAGAAPYDDTDYTAGLSTTSLQGARLGYIEPAQPNELFTAALATLRAEGATLVPVTVGNTRAGSILTLEFERDLNAYLDRLPESAPMDSLTDIVEFNKTQPNRMKFGQTLLVESEAVDLTDPATLASYEATKAQGLTETRAAIDSVLTANDLDAIVSPQSTTGVAARAGYPSVIVPAGYFAANGRPGGISFAGTAWTEASLLSLAYDYEQASMKRRGPSEVNPTLFQCLDGFTKEAWCAP